MIKITISVAGRFHAFDLAEQLQKRQALNRLITPYPKFKVKNWGIPSNKITNLLTNEFFLRGWNKLPSFIKNTWNPDLFLKNRFDNFAKNNIPLDTDLFIGWSGSSYNTLSKAKKQGIVTVLERGSSHILFQTEILSEEYKCLGLPPSIAHPKIIERELQEYQTADFISIPSQFVKSTFVKFGIPEKKLIVNPYGVNISDFNPIEKKDSKFRVIFCGSLSIRKGIHYLLQAFYELNLKDSELWLIGPKSIEIDKFLTKYKHPHIHYKGSYPQSKLNELYSQGSVFCLPSIEEGLAMVILQAMACGLPIICTTNTGGQDIIGEGINGFTIPPRNVGSIKEKLLFLYENPGICKKMGISARNMVKRGFSWDDYGNRAMKNFYEILNSNGSATK